MNINNIIRALFIAVSVAASAVLYPVFAQAVTFDDLSMTVAFLRGNNKAGTGFFVLADHPVLVTAEHVANVLTPTSSLTVRGYNDTPINLKIGDLVSNTETLAWERHPENDVAVLRLQSPDQLHFLDKRFFPIKQLISYEAPPARNGAVIIMGFPLMLGTTGRFSPISMAAKTASGLLRMRRFDTGKEATFFVLDKPSISIGGFSGGPVFMMPGITHMGGGQTLSPGKDVPTICVGLVHGYIGDEGGTLAAIVPAKAIFDTIKAAGALQK